MKKEFAIEKELIEKCFGISKKKLGPNFLRTLEII